MKRREQYAVMCECKSIEDLPAAMEHAAKRLRLFVNISDAKFAFSPGDDFQVGTFGVRFTAESEQSGLAKLRAIA